MTNVIKDGTLALFTDEVPVGGQGVLRRFDAKAGSWTDVALYVKDGAGAPTRARGVMPPAVTEDMDMEEIRKHLDFWTSLYTAFGDL